MLELNITVTETHSQTCVLSPANGGEEPEYCTKEGEKWPDLINGEKGYWGKNEQRLREWQVVTKTLMCATVATRKRGERAEKKERRGGWQNTCRFRKPSGSQTG